MTETIDGILQADSNGSITNESSAVTALSKYLEDLCSHYAASAGNESEHNAIGSQIQAMIKKIQGLKLSDDDKKALFKQVLTPDIRNQLLTLNGSDHVLFDNVLALLEEISPDVSSFDDSIADCDPAELKQVGDIIENAMSSLSDSSAAFKDLTAFAEKYNLSGDNLGELVRTFQQVQSCKGGDFKANLDDMLNHLGGSEKEIKANLGILGKTIGARDSFGLKDDMKLLESLTGSAKAYFTDLQKEYDLGDGFDLSELAKSPVFQIQQLMCSVSLFMAHLGSDSQANIKIQTQLAHVGITVAIAGVAKAADAAKKIRRAKKWGIFAKIVLAIIMAVMTAVTAGAAGPVALMLIVGFSLGMSFAGTEALEKALKNSGCKSGLVIAISMLVSMIGDAGVGAIGQKVGQMAVKKAVKVAIMKASKAATKAAATHAAQSGATTASTAALNDVAAKIGNISVDSATKNIFEHMAKMSTKNVLGLAFKGGFRDLAEATVGKEVKAIVKNAGQKETSDVVKKEIVKVAGAISRELITTTVSNSAKKSADTGVNKAMAQMQQALKPISDAMKKVSSKLSKVTDSEAKSGLKAALSKIDNGIQSGFNLVGRGLSKMGLQDSATEASKKALGRLARLGALNGAMQGGLGDKITEGLNSALDKAGLGDGIGADILRGVVDATALLAVTAVGGGLDPTGGASMPDVQEGLQKVLILGQLTGTGAGIVGNIYQGLAQIDTAQSQADQVQSHNVIDTSKSSSEGITQAFTTESTIISKINNGLASMEFGKANDGE